MPEVASNSEALDPEVYDRLLVEWIYPVLAASAGRRRLPIRGWGRTREILDPLPR